MLVPGAKPVVEFRTTLSSEYRLLGLVGQGEFAQVYCAVHRRSGRLAAIKQIRHAREAASQETLVMQQVNHPNVVGCHAISKVDVGDSEGGVGVQLVLDYCEGGTLRSRLHNSQNTAIPLTANEIQHLVEDILSGLDHVHQQGIIHGDLKPENIFLTYPDQPRSALVPIAKIGDFGSARFIELQSDTASGPKREMGSPTYAAPERFEGHSSIAADLYSVGVILYELLTGDRPFSGSPESLKVAHQTKAVPFPTTLTLSAKRLLSTALHKEPQRRFTSAKEMLSAVRQLFAGADGVSAQKAVSVRLRSYTSLTQKAVSLYPLSPLSITTPIKSLLSLPQGCCVATDRSLHLVTRNKELLSIDRFSHPCWTAVSPSGKWFVAFPKPSEEQRQEESKNQYLLRHPRKMKGTVGAFSTCSKSQWRRSITLEGPLLTALCANILQFIALDERYFLRVSTTDSSTYLECFTRHGKFVGEVSFNLSLTQMIPTSVPYQFVGLCQLPAQKGSRTQDDQVMAFISLKPLQITPIRLSVVPEKVSVLSWGYFVSYQESALFLDRSARLLSLVSDVPTQSVIASIDTSTILVASNSTSLENQSVTSTSIRIVDVRSLNLDMIF